MLRLVRQAFMYPFSVLIENPVEGPTSTAGNGKSISVAKLGTITLDVFDEKVTCKSYSASDRVPKFGQSSDFAEKELKGRNVTHQATYANPGLLTI